MLNKEVYLYRFITNYIKNIYNIYHVSTTDNSLLFNKSFGDLYLILL